MAATAEALLNGAVLGDGIVPAWAVFDAAWYLETWAEVAEACDGDTGRALAHYLETGAAAGFSPSPLFDERWYLET